MAIQIKVCSTLVSKNHAHPIIIRSLWITSQITSVSQTQSTDLSNYVVDLVLFVNSQPKILILIGFYSSYKNCSLLVQKKQKNDDSTSFLYFVEGTKIFLLDLCTYAWIFYQVSTKINEEPKKVKIISWQRLIRYLCLVSCNCTWVITRLKFD